MAGVRKFSHRDKKFQDVSNHLYADGCQVVMEEHQQQSQSENTSETR